jgi:nucleoside-diphosphate-sugar epimerase
MRVFVTGASGALGSRLVPQLIDTGHEVTGTHHSPASAELLRALGANPVRLDLLDAGAVRKAVLENEPEAIVHEATALANVKFSRNMDKVAAKTSELRTKGTDALLAAAREAGVRRFVAQSVASFSRYAREGGPVKTEDDPLDPTPPKNFDRSAAAMAYLEQAVTDFGGIALRYGAFYGAANDGTIEPVRKRQFPIVGDGGGIWSWIHLDDAAAATVLALEHDGPAIYNIVDDDPAPVREWLPVLAQALGAKPPRRFPTWLARLLAGEAVTVMSTEARGASNAKAKRELGWTPRYPTWRQGFAEVYADLAASTATSRATPARSEQAQARRQSAT